MVQSQDLFDALRISESRLKRRLSIGRTQEKELLTAVEALVIRDRLVYPKNMTFAAAAVDAKPADFVLVYEDAQRFQEAVSIHPHALGQLCAKAGLPMTYVATLHQHGAADEWKRQLLAHNLNELFHRPEMKERGGTSARFLHRIVGKELRGFLSRRYNRHLASWPLLQAFLEATRRQGAEPVESMATPVRVALKCILPRVFEAFPGEYVAIGAEWSNSDFGAGKHKVCQTVWRIDTATSAVLDEAISRVHVGSVIEDSDVEMSDETAKKEVEAQRGAISDAVTAMLSEVTVDRMLQALRAARDEKIPWTKLKGQLGKFLAKSDIDWLQKTLDTGETIIDLPPISFEPDGTRTPNAYWASVAVGQIAARTENTDRRIELQREAGKLLAGLLGGA